MNRNILVLSPTLRDKAKKGILMSLDGMLVQEVFKRTIPCTYEIKSVLPEYKKAYTDSEISEAIESYYAQIPENTITLLFGSSLIKSMIPRLKRTSMKDINGLMFTERERSFLCSYHPIEVIQNQKLYPEFEVCLHRFALGYTYNPITGPHDIQVYKLDSDSESILSYYNEHLAGYAHVSYDIETNLLSPYATNFGPIPVISMIGFATDTHTLICINDAVYSDGVRSIFQTSKNLVGHNSFSFDDLWIHQNLGIKEFRSMDDTMIIHYSTDERRGTHGLKSLATKFYALPDYGGALKNFISEDGVLTSPEILESMIQYLDYDVRVTWYLYKDLFNNLTPNQSQVYNKTLKPASDALRRMHSRGVCIDSAYLRDLKLRLDREVEALIVEIRDQLSIRDFNINSPKQVAEVLFDRLQLPVPKEGRKTGYDIIETLAPYDLTGVCLKIRDARQKKVISRNFVDGILTRLNLDNRVRAYFMLIGTETGRLACRNPNLQNIPKRFGKEIRKSFIAPEGYVLVECDYSQLELRVAAYISGDEAMIQAFREDQDIHRLIASKMYGREPELITAFQRGMAKFVGFGMLYGRSTMAIADQLKVNLLEEGRLEEASDGRVLMRQAESIVREFHEGFPQLHAWIENTKKSVRERGYAESAYNRRRNWSLFTAESVNSSLREGVNFPIQSTGADICLKALTNIEARFHGEHVRPVLTVHDSILFEVAEDQKDFLISEIVKIMENPEGLEGTMRWKVDTKWGKDWGNLQ